MSEFGNAFASARKAGKKTFKFNGKSYTTKTKEETAPTPRSRPAKKSAPTPRSRPADKKKAGNARPAKADEKDVKIPVKKKKTSKPAGRGNGGGGF